MSQLKPIININSNFERGNAVGFVEGGSAAGDAILLDRRDDRLNPKRRVFPQLLKSRSDYIYNGRFSRRYPIPTGGNITITMNSVPVRPGMIITFGLVFRQDYAPNVTIGNAPRVALTGDLSGGGTMTANPVKGITERTIAGEPWSYIWEAAATSVALLDPLTGQPIWYRIGFTMECPMEMETFTPVVRNNGPAAGLGNFDVGEISLQGQLSQYPQAG